MDKLFVLIYYFIAYFFKYIPKIVQKQILLALSYLLYIIDRQRKKVAKINLDFVYGNSLSQKEKLSIIKRCYKNLVFYIIDSIKNSISSKEEILSKVTFENSHILEELLKANKQIIFIGAHYSNWEIMPLAVAAKFNIPLVIVGRKLGIEILDRLLLNQRERFGIEILDKNKSAKSLITALKLGKYLGLVVDQNTATNEGVLVSFFNKEARHTHSASILAYRHNCIIVPIFVNSDDFFHFKIRFYEPITPNKDANVEEEILRLTQAQANITEKVIRERPHEWFWFHKRWKNRYEHIYK